MATPDTRAGLLSVVIPVFNEAEGIADLHARLTRALAGHDYECLFVNDGSTDPTAFVIRELAARDPRVKLVSLSRNFGQQAAISAGLAFARGASVAVMDADLQDPPELLPEMVRLWAKGADVVYGVRRKRREGWLKRLAYRAFYRLMGRLASIEIPPDAGDFSVMDRRVVDLIASMGESHRYVRGLRSWVGFRQVPFPYEREPRRRGAPRYTLAKLIDLALTGIVAFSYAPLRLATLAGAALSLLAFALGLFYLAQRLLGFRVFGRSPEDVPGFTTVFVVMAFLFGIQLLMLGVLGEYVGRIFEEVKRRPHYVVDELVGVEAPAGARRGDHSAPPPG
jgi:glycosyltransferase involved in cell wall biosynthesis